LSVLRHVQVPFGTYRQTAKEVVILARDMYGTAYGIAADPTAGSYFNSPYWSFDPDTVQGIGADAKLPLDRVPGTPLKFRFVYTIPTGPGGGNVVWRLDWLIRNKGNWINVVPNTSIVVDKTLSRGELMVTDPIIIKAHEVDIQHLAGEGQPVNLQLGIIRQADDVNDTETSPAYLFKLLMEYRAYV